MNKAIIWGAALVATSPLLLSAKKKPNIIYILADDLGYAELGSFGQQLIETPNLDRLAAEGMQFTNHYSGTAVSAPSRCVLFTGLHTGHAYIRGNDEMPERGKVNDHASMLDNPALEGQRPVPAETVMIPALLKKAGYTTACVGKWGLGHPGSVSTPNKMGFDFFYGYNCQRQAHTYYPCFLWRNEEREYLANDLQPVPHSGLAKDADIYDPKSYDEFSQTDYAPDRMFKEISDFIDKEKNNPFALFWTTPIPHVPLQAPKEWVDYYVDKLGDEEPYTGNKGYFPCRYPRATYAAMISYLDWQIGEVVKQLKEEGLYEQTIIIISSDNGPTFNGGSDSYFFDSAKPFKSEQGWGKVSLREGGIRVPMIASWPEKIKPGSISNHLSAFWDVMPTLCEIASIECPQTDGISFLPELLGKKQKEHEFLYWEFPEGGGQKAVRMGKWKGIIRDIFKGNQTMELFNLEIDPREQTDLARFYPEIIKEMHQVMEREHEEPEIEKFKL